jgi:hypothetical protein
VFKHAVSCLGELTMEHGVHTIQHAERGNRDTFEADFCGSNRRKSYFRVPERERKCLWATRLGSLVRLSRFRVRPTGGKGKEKKKSNKQSPSNTGLGQNTSRTRRRMHLDSIDEDIHLCNNETRGREEARYWRR